jgi:hypothetical protein
MRRNYRAPTQQADLTECTIKNLLEKFPRRKRIGRNSQNCTEMREPSLVIVTGAEIPQEVAPLIVEFAEIKKHKNFELDET